MVRFLWGFRCWACWFFTFGKGCFGVLRQLHIVLVVRVEGLFLAFLFLFLQALGPFLYFVSTLKNFIKEIYVVWAVLGLHSG